MSFRWLLCALAILPWPQSYVFAQEPLAQVRVTREMPAVVNVRITAPQLTRTVPAELFGSFLEPIGNSINNGLMAQVLVNPSFESGLWDQENLKRLLEAEPALTHLGFIRGLPLPWLPWDEHVGNRYETHVGHAANSYQSVELIGVPRGQVGLMQSVYLPIHRTRKYVATVYARRDYGPGELTFAFRSERGQILVAKPVFVASSTWTKYRVALSIPERTVAPLERLKFGVFTGDGSRIEIDQLSLTPADAVGGFDPDVLALAKAMGMTELRFGGNFSSFYHWRDGIGDPDHRRTMINVGWGIPEYNNFGTDEFLRLCKLLNVTPQVDLNMGSGTAEEAKQWVKYIRQRTRGPVIWELGNELWGPWQLGPPAFDQFPARTLAFSKAVRQASPNDRIIATGGTPTEFGAWTAAELRLPPGSFQDISLHFVETSGRDSIWKPRTEAANYMVYAKSFQVGEVLSEIKSTIDATDHRTRVHLALTEWLFNSMGEGEGNFTNDFPAWNNQGGAVAAGGFLNTLLRHAADVDLADMTGMIEFAGIAKRKEVAFAQPAYYVFQMYSAAKNDRILPVETDSGTYSIVDPTYAFTAGQAVPYVDAAATISPDGHRIRAFLVNRWNHEAHVQISLPSNIESRYTTVISGPGTFAQNTEAEPTRIVPRTTHDNGNPDILIPEESVVEVVFLLR